MRPFEDLYLPFTVCNALKEIGFNDACMAGFLIDDDGQFCIYDDWQLGSADAPMGFINTPTYQQAIDWFEKTFELYINIGFNADIINSNGVVLIHKNSQIEEWSGGEFITGWRKVFDKRYPINDSKYKSNIKQYPNSAQYKVKTFTKNEVLNMAILEAIKFIKNKAV